MIGVMSFGAFAGGFIPVDERDIERVHGFGPDAQREAAEVGAPFYIWLTKYTVTDILGKMNILPSTLYPAIAHETRLRCLLLLLEHDELCVCELTHAIGAAQPTMSRHLAHLREAELVSDRREGLWIHYRINPELPAWVTNVLRETANGVEGVAPFTEDLAALENMPNRPGAPRCA